MLAFSTLLLLHVTILYGVNLPVINKTQSCKGTLRQYPKLHQIKIKSKKAFISISSAILRKNDLITVVSTEAMGKIIDLNIQKRHYLIKFTKANLTNEWIPEYELKKGMPSIPQPIQN